MHKIILKVVMKKCKFIFQTKLDKMNNNLTLVALKVVIVQNQFTQNYFSCAIIKYECLSQPVSEDGFT